MPVHLASCVAFVLRSHSLSATQDTNDANSLSAAQDTNDAMQIGSAQSLAGGVHAPHGLFKVHLTQRPACGVYHT